MEALHFAEINDNTVSSVKNYRYQRNLVLSMYWNLLQNVKLKPKVIFELFNLKRELKKPLFEYTDYKYKTQTLLTTKNLLCDQSDKKQCLIDYA